MSFDEGIDEWDENFLDEAIRVELEALSSRNLPSNDPIPINQPRNPNPNPTWTRSEHEASVLSFSSFGFDGGGGRHVTDLGFSPPRELSQRFPEKPEASRMEVDECKIVEPWVTTNVGYSGRGGGGAGKDKEVEKLKRELGRISKQFTHMVDECAELRKAKEKKDEQLKSAVSQIEVKEAEIQRLKRANLETCKQNQVDPSLQPQQADGRVTKRSYGNCKNISEPSGDFAVKSEFYGPNEQDAQIDGISAVSELKRRIMVDNSMTTSSSFSLKERSLREENAQLKSNKTVGVQTDLVQDHSHIAYKDEISMGHIVSRKLHTIWSSQIDKPSGQSLVSKLYANCSADFYALFSASRPSNQNLDVEVGKSFSGMALHESQKSIQSNDAAKVAQLSAILTKMHKGLAQLHALIEALLDLCTLENDFIVHKSLCILHALLRQLLSCDVISGKRNNVLLDQSSSQKRFLEEQENELCKQTTNCDEYVEIYNGNGTSGFFSSAKDFSVETLCKTADGISWSSLFETMRQIAIRNKVDCIRVEAVFIMNLITMRSNPISERNNFLLLPLLESMLQLLRNDVHLQVQMQAVRLLFLLLNCPKMLAIFCSGQKDGSELSEACDGQNDASKIQGAVVCILERLAECLAKGGTSTEDLKLQRHVIVMLAFIAASCISGFELLLNSAASEGANFLQLLIHVLASKMDAEDIAETQISQDLYKERILLMREALILLNRLVSNPSYSKVSLGVLTTGNATATLTIDVANRLSRKNQHRMKHDNMKITQMEAEIVDLARSFRARVFCFLGENTS